MYSLAIFHIVLASHVKQKHIKMCVMPLRDDVNLYWVFTSFHIEGWLIPSIFFCGGINRPHKSQRDKTKSYNFWPKSRRNTKPVCFWCRDSKAGDWPCSNASSLEQAAQRSGGCPIPSRTGWMGPQATGSNGWHPYPWWGSWNQVVFEVLSNPIHSVIPWFFWPEVISLCLTMAYQLLPYLSLFCIMEHKMYLWTLQRNMFERDWVIKQGGNDKKYWISVFIPSM